MSDFCKYSKSLGEPNIGLHTHYFGFAIFDLIGTIIISFILTYITKKYIKNMSFSLIFSIILLILVIIAEYLHELFCIYN